jgi:hypothetical protein
VQPEPLSAPRREAKSLNPQSEDVTDEEQALL